MNDLISFGKALSDPTRIRILRALMQCELCVCELVDALEISQSTVSTHLQSLRASGILTTEKRQTWIIYSVADTYRQALDDAFHSFPTKDARLERDSERIATRLTLRVDGCCVVGSTSQKDERKYASTNN